MEAPHLKDVKFNFERCLKAFAAQYTQGMVWHYEDALKLPTRNYPAAMEQAWHTSASHPPKVLPQCIELMDA